MCLYKWILYKTKWYSFTTSCKIVTVSCRELGQCYSIFHTLLRSIDEYKCIHIVTEYRPWKSPLPSTSIALHERPLLSPIWSRQEITAMKYDWREIRHCQWDLRTTPTLLVCHAVTFDRSVCICKISSFMTESSANNKPLSSITDSTCTWGVHKVRGKVLSLY